MSFRSLIALPSFCLFGLSITEKKVLKSPSIVDVSVSPLNFVNFYFVYFEALLLGMYTFNIAVLSCELALSHYKMTLSIFGNTPCLEVYFV